MTTTPTPAIPTFTDGLVVHATTLNALSSNLTNLYTYGQASFTSQKPCVVAQQTTGQTITGVDTLLNFQTATVNTDNMWTASVPNQLTVQHAGIYYVWSVIAWAVTATGSFGNHGISYILINGSTASSAVATSGNVYGTTAGNCAASTSCIINLAAGATIFSLGNSQGANNTLGVALGGSTLGAMYMTSAT